MVSEVVRLVRRWALPTAALLATAAWTVPARAQSIELTVNGDPVTSADVEQQIVFRRATHASASRGEAVEDLIADRLKLHEANRFGVDASEADLQQTLSRIAAQAKLNVQGLAAALQKNKASTEIVRDHLHAIAAWNNYVRARNKGLNVSEADIAAAIAKDPNRAQDATQLTLQEIVFVTPVKATVGEVEQRMREAQALRGRFNDCGSGIALARALPNVAVKDAIRRDAKSLSENARKELDQTASGHLSPPERTVSGVQMIAVCGKDQSTAGFTIRDNVQADLVRDRLAKIGDRMYRDLRATAVIEKH